MDLEPAFAAQFVAARWVHYAACLLLLGVWAFDRLVVAPTARQCAGAGVMLRYRRIASWLLVVALPAAIVSMVGWFVLVGMNMSDEPMSAALQPGVLKLVAFQTDFGHAWLVHGGLLIVAVVGAVAWRMARAGVRSGLGWVNLVVAGGVVAGIAWAGHGATGPAPGWHRLADVVHLLIAGVWPSGLLPLALLLMGVKRGGTAAREWVPVASLLVRRFSSVSMIAVPLLVGSGLVNSWCLVGSLSALWTSAYGRVLLVKLGLLAAMLVAGAWNLLVLKPRLGSGGWDAESPSDADRISKGLLVSVAIEWGLGIAVIGVVAVLGLMVPARF